jgi:hypothetical protein
MSETEMTNQEAILERFMENNAAIIGKLETLKKFHENHMNLNPEELLWGHVGNTDHVLELLDNIFKFLSIEEEEVENDEG